MNKKALTSCFTAVLISFSSAYAQTTDTEPTSLNAPAADEIIVEGERGWGNHKGMNAFFDSDFETAEIEFEREFKSLRRFKSGQENAAFDGENQQLRSQQLGAFSSTSGGNQGGPVGGNSSLGSGGENFAATPTSNFARKQARGRSVLTDGKVTYEDFALTRYMAGLSEIKLGKISEAKDSFKTSLTYNHKNYDARMRLGLIYLQEKDYERAASQLKKLDKLRKKCEKISCEDMDFIRDSTVILAKAITQSSQSQ